MQISLMMRGVPAKWKVKIPVKNAIGRTAKMEMIQINKMIVATYFFYKRAQKKKLSKYRHSKEK